MKPDERFKNAVIYGTSHPEVYMTKADELWKKYYFGIRCKGDEQSFQYVDKDGFLAALQEYGESVRQQAADRVRPRTKRPCDCEICDCGNSGNLQAVTYWDESNWCAAAIEKMEIK